MARTQYAFTFRNATPGATVTFSDTVYASKTAQAAEGPTLVLDSSRTVAVWSDATELTATWVDGAGTAVSAEASVAIPVVVETAGTPGIGPEPADVVRLQPRGAWVTSTVYAVNDSVTANGVAWRCILAHTSGGSFSADPTKWERFGVGQVVSSAPSSPATDDLWYDKTNDLWKRWTGSAWKAEGSASYLAGQVVDTNDVPVTPGKQVRVKLDAFGDIDDLIIEVAN